MTTKKQDHMRIWSQVDRTDPSTTKPVSFGRKFTAIDAQFQRKRATEVFGPIGQGYGVSDVEIKIMDLLDGTVKLANYQAQLWWQDDPKGPVNKFPIGSSIKIVDRGRVDDEWLKKVATDALTKGLSMLGFNSDVFEGKFDDNRYVQAVTEEFKTGDKSVSPKITAPDSLKTFQSIFELAVKEGGTPAFRGLWGQWAREDLNQDQVKACKAHIKISPDGQTWLQELKKKAAAADERLEAENAAK